VSTSVWGAVFYLCFMTLRGLQGPILATLMQADAPTRIAGVLSLVVLLFGPAFVAAGPPIGALVDRIGIETASACSRCSSPWSLSRPWPVRPGTPERPSSRNLTAGGHPLAKIATVARHLLLLVHGKP